MYLIYIDGQRMQLRDRPLEPQEIAEICRLRHVRFEDTFSSGIYHFYCFTRKAAKATLRDVRQSVA